MQDLMKLKNATRLAVALTVLLVAGCAEPMQGADVAIATKHCLDAGGNPDYFHNGAKTHFECKVKGN
jgi:hypothetical protein